MRAAIKWTTAEILHIAHQWAALMSPERSVRQLV